MEYEKHCDCLFCNLRCPRCGKEEVHVWYLVRFSLTNNKPDRVRIHHSDQRAIVFCPKCEDELDFDEIDVDLRDLSTGFFDGQDNGRLALSLAVQLGINSANIVIDDEGELKTRVSSIRVVPGGWNDGGMVTGSVPGKEE